MLVWLSAINMVRFWARRHGQHSWQFPQGGIHEGESPEEAMYRELFEEVGLKPNDVKLLTTHKQWLKYKIPKHLVRWDSEPVCFGQKQNGFCSNSKHLRARLCLVRRGILNSMIGRG